MWNLFINFILFCKMHGKKNVFEINREPRELGFDLFSWSEDVVKPGRDNRSKIKIKSEKNINIKKRR